jgi:hypothetical protein
MLALSMGWMFQLNSGMTMSQVGLATLAFVVRLLTTWAYWKGKNWARILACIYSAFCLIRLLQWNHVTALTRELWMCEAALAIFLLFYLPQREVSAWFTGGKKTEAPQPETTEPEEACAGSQPEGGSQPA